jgi:hypothetical protein
MMISAGSIEDIKVDIYNEELKQLIKKILTKNPEFRPSASEILNEPILSLRAE